MEESEVTKEKIKKVKKKKDSNKSAETMFRTTMASHTQLSTMADQKAGLLVSINSIVLSVMLSLMVQQFPSNPILLIPTGLLVLVSMFTITYSLISTRPSVPNDDNKKQKDIDLLFFGDFTKMSLDDYKEAMFEIIEKDKVTKTKMIENIYGHGKVIERKYKHLKMAYTIFMYGFPLVLLSYLVVFYISYF